MKPILVFDTETTGLPLFSEPSEHPDQPHIVQLGAALYDPIARTKLASIDLVIKPDGWIIPDDVAAIHGITTEIAAARGVPEGLAIELLLELQEVAEYRLAYNETFDMRVVRIACMRHMTDTIADTWKAAPAKCAAKAATPIVKLAPTDRMRAAGRLNFKMPKLSEAYKFFTGLDLDGAHNAMIDVDACAAVWFAIEDRAAQGAAA